LETPFARWQPPRLERARIADHDVERLLRDQPSVGVLFAEKSRSVPRSE
jgi:hypothetical protein